MERREAAHLPEDDLMEAYRSVKKALYLLQDVVNDFFIYSDELRAEQSFEISCDEYGSASAKTEIARDLLADVRKILKELLSV